MANAWSEHVKKTMAEMKSAANGKTVMLRDVLKAAGKTYKKSSGPSDSSGSSNKKTSKRQSSKRKSGKRKSSKRKSSKRKRSRRSKN